MARAKLKNLTKVNGKTNTVLPPNSLAAVLGDSGLEKYGTFDENEYKAKLESLSTPELHLAATKEGIKPIHSRELIIKSLLSNFYRHKNSYFGQQRQIASNQNLSKDMKEIFRQIT